MPQASLTSVISHWYKLIEGLQASSQEFYESVEQAIQKREAPGADTSRVEWREGGAFSADREYLRVKRGENTFDICGAPFGNGFFVSWWLGEPRPSPLIPTIAAVILSGAIWNYAGSELGMTWGFVVMLLAWLALFILMGMMVGAGGQEPWMRHLAVIPIFGPLLERFIFTRTYYRIDTALMFQSAIHSAVMEAVDGLTNAKGLRALSEDERKPILRDFYRR